MFEELDKFENIGSGYIDITKETYIKSLRDARKHCVKYIDMFEEIYGDMNENAPTILGDVKKSLKSVISDTKKLMKTLKPLDNDDMKNMNKDEIVDIFETQKEIILSMLEECKKHEI